MSSSSSGTSNSPWECFIQGDGCQCDQLGFDYPLEDCGSDWVCCVYFTDPEGDSCVCSQSQQDCDDVLDFSPEASAADSCP